MSDLTVGAIKEAMARERKAVRDKIVSALIDEGAATTSALREMFSQYSDKHRRSQFWGRLTELESEGVIARAGATQLHPWEFPETIWKLAA